MSDIVDAVAESLKWLKYGSAPDRAVALITALSKAGYAVVPREPTEAMIAAGEAPFDEPFGGGRLTSPSAVWGAMLAAASPASPAPSYSINHKREPYQGENEGNE